MNQEASFSEIERKLKNHLVENHIPDRNLQAILLNSSLPLHVTVLGFLIITRTIIDIKVDPLIVPRNYPESKKMYARQLIHQSADQNEMYAQFLLAISYRSGLWHVRDNDQAFQWYQKSAKSNNLVAYHHLGTCYQYSIGCRRDMDKAYKCYSKFGDGFQDGLMSFYLKGEATIVPSIIAGSVGGRWTDADRTSRPATFVEFCLGDVKFLRTVSGESVFPYLTRHFDNLEHLTFAKALHT
ncbi:10045_t:CDS:2, partial [Ambispora gerdemannii]